MSGYLARLSALTLGAVPVLRPTSAARYGARPEIVDAAELPGRPRSVDRPHPQSERPSTAPAETPPPSMQPKEEEQRRLLPLRARHDAAEEVRAPVESDVVRIDAGLRIETEDGARGPATLQPVRAAAARRRRDGLESAPPLAQARREPVAGSESDDAPETPTVHVHIGRIDVRAVQSPDRRSVAPKTSTLVKPSLDAHLQKRDRGRP